MSTIQDRPPNFRENGKLYLVRCFNCGGEHGRENWAMAVAMGYCSWCNWPRGVSVRAAMDDEAPA